jgi:hypothetical protein
MLYIVKAATDTLDLIGVKASPLARWAPSLVTTIDQSLSGPLTSADLTASAKSRNEGSPGSFCIRHCVLDEP